MKCCEHSSRKRLFKVYLIIPIILSNGDSLDTLYWRHVSIKKSSPGVTETLYETIVFEAKSVGIGLLQPLDLVLQDGDTVLLNRKTIYPSPKMRFNQMSPGYLSFLELCP